MELSDELHCLFSATVDERNGSYVIEVPKREVRLGDLQDGETYRVAVLSSPSSDEGDDTSPEQKQEQEHEQARRSPAAPVREGEQRTVEIEDLGDQGDGLTRVERGFVVIVPDTERGERVTVEITDVRKNVAFAEVVERISYYG